MQYKYNLLMKFAMCDNDLLCPKKAFYQKRLPNMCMYLVLFCRRRSL